MKNRSKQIICCFLAFQLLWLNHYPVSYAASNSSKKTKAPKISIHNALDAEAKFYKGDFDGASVIFETLGQKRDRNYALFNNQLGSIYLAKGNHEKALDAFLKAYYLMNDIEAFSDLEAEAISLLGSEDKKAYKGDPYEKVYNSLYTGLLLANKEDIDNALAALKNGILCDSDVKADLYQSDVFMLYLFAARFSLMQGNESLSEDYFEKAREAYYLTASSNWAIVAQEQAQRFLLIEKQEELDKLENPKKYAKKAKVRGTIITGQAFDKKEKKGTVIYRNKKILTKIEKLQTEIEEINSNIERLAGERINNNKSIDTSELEKFIDLGNNAFLFIELGKGPLKYQIGQYGQLAIFTIKPHGVKTVNITVNGKLLANNLFLLNNDTFFQATTRGGRQMDGILKGQAQYKKTTADISMAFRGVSKSITESANRMTSASPYYDASGAYAAGAAIALIALAFAIASDIANPAADARHWSLLPGNIMVIPLSLKTGEHAIKFEGLNAKDERFKSLEFDIEVKNNKNNIIFKRIF